MKKKYYFIIYVILFIGLSGIFYACKDNRPSKDDIIQREINCYNDVFIAVVDTFGYYGCLIPPAASPSVDGDEIDRSNDHSDNSFSINLLQKGISPVIIVKDSLVNFTKINLLRNKRPITTDSSFNKLIDRLYTDSSLHNIYFPTDQMDKVEKYTIRPYSDTIINSPSQEKKIVGSLLFSRIIFENDMACFYCEISNPKKAGMGEIVLLNKNTNGAWQIVSEIQLWRS